MQPKKTKVLVIAHGHPDNAKGGGEIAAYNLHNKLNTSSEYHSVFLARHDRDELLHPGTQLSGSGRPNEIMLHSNRNDYFLHSTHNKVFVGREFRQVLEQVNPDIVHFHHYVHFGLEFIREARAFNPDVRIILTLHEYIAICNNSGQMMTTQNALCHESSPSACVKCFPQHSPQDFLMRKLFFNSHFDLVDTFISPSQFLKDRYVNWGISQDRIHVIENMLDDSKYTEAPAVAENVTPSTSTKSNKSNKSNKSGKSGKSGKSSERVRFSFYGQINWFKGLDVLLTAISKLPKEIRDCVQLDINGSGLESQPKHLQDQINKLIASMLDVVNMRGPYTQTELSSLMNSSHWMIVPSKWWENSPMVILEARKHGLPVLCSDIGGMAEKVHNKVTGIHFQAGRADALASAITWAVKNPDQQPSFAAAIKAGYKEGESFDQHARLYNQLLSEETSAAPFTIQSVIDNVKAENNVYHISNATDAA